MLASLCPSRQMLKIDVANPSALVIAQRTGLIALLSSGLVPCWFALGDDSARCLFNSNVTV